MDQERFLIVPFGLLYSEVTASSLVRTWGFTAYLFLTTITWTVFAFVGSNLNCTVTYCLIQCKYKNCIRLSCPFMTVFIHSPGQVRSSRGNSGSGQH